MEMAKEAVKSDERKKWINVNVKNKNKIKYNMIRFNYYLDNDTSYKI